jgi:type 1 fimbria pilin
MSLRCKVLAAAAVFVVTAGHAHAQSAMLTVSGRVTAPGCSISVSPVAFGDVPITNFSDTQYAKEFQVTLSGCAISALTSASLKFDGMTTAALPNSTGLALNDPGTSAQGIAVSVYTNDDVHGVVGTAVRFDNATSYPFAVASGKSTYGFQARLVAIPGGTVRTGTTNATATVTLSYS